MELLARWSMVFVFAVFVAGAALAQQNASSSLTIEALLSAPFPTELTAAPAKERFAWVFNAEGRRNVWTAEPSADKGGQTARQLTAYTEDDGMDVGELAWTPDAEAIVFVRGGDFEDAEKPNPNPRHFPQGSEQALWVISAHGGEPRKLTEGHSPAVSPKGDSVAYILKDQVWLVRFDGSGKAAQLIQAKGQSDSLRWSPAGTRLAFVSRRGDHSFIGVYDFSLQSVTYLDASVDSDSEPVWSPDGKLIAFVRVANEKNALPFAPRRAGLPWAICVADASTGKGREVWRSAEGKGSAFRKIVADNQLFWAVGDRLVFPWEHDGWTHLYSFSLKGGEAKLLTPGNFEVEYVVLSADRRSLFFSSNQDDIDRRHVWQVPASGETPPAPVTATRGGGIETAPAIASDNRTVAFLRSDAHVPMRPAILGGRGEMRDLAPNALPADFPAPQLVVPQQVIFSGADGLAIHGQLFLPANTNDRTQHPAMIFFHGGSRRQMLLGWHYMDYYSNAYAMNQYLASRGYVVLSVNYRSGIGYGLDFREALNYGAAGASEYNDVLGAGLYLRTRSDVDPQRIGLWGGSYGGYLTALGLARSSDMFAAGVDVHGVHDWNIEIGNWLPGYDPSAGADFARLAFASSPMSAIKTWRSPVLLIQGDDDRNVQFAQTVQLAEALRKQGVPFEQLVFPDEIHDFLLHRTWRDAYSAAADFLDRHLAAASAGSPASH